MKVNFYSNSPLSELDLTTMGGSSKRGDETLVGMYSSGLKYAIAILRRNGVDFSVRVKTNEYIENHDRNVDIIYTVGSYTQEDPQTGKDKELLMYHKSSNYQNFHSGVVCDEWGGEYETEVKTGFSVDLGFDWKLQYALREIWSNMRDEKGWYDQEEKPNLDKEGDGTIITLEFDEDSEFAQIWRDRYLYFVNPSEQPLVTFKNYQNEVEIRKSQTDHLRIYKQGILVFENEDEKSAYTYNINFGDLDERRVLSNVYDIKNRIANIIIADSSPEALDFLLNTDSDEVDVFYKDILFCPHLTKELIERVTELDGNVKTFAFVLEALRKMENSPLASRKIKTLKESVYEAQRTVTVEETTREIAKIEEQLSLSDTLRKRYNFDFDTFSIKEVTLKGSNVVADKYSSLILVSKDFDIDNPDHEVEFFIQCFDLMGGGKGNVIRKMSKFIIERIKK